MRRMILILPILLGGLACVSGCHHDDDDDKNKKVALHIPKETPKRPQGAGALTVKTGSAEPFTKADVANYFKTHNLPTNMGSTSDFTVDTLEFLTNQQVTTRLNGASPGLSENDKLGFATLTGLFIFTGPRQSNPARFKRAYAAFDASTGNLMMIGTLEQGEQPKGEQPK